MKQIHIGIKLMLAVIAMFLAGTVVWMAGEVLSGKTQREIINLSAESQVMGTEITPAGQTESSIPVSTEPEPSVPVTTAEAQVTEPEAEESTILLFAGDVYLSNHVLNAYEKAGGINGVLDETLRAQIEGAHIFMVNQEFPFSDRGQAAANKEYTFRLPPERVALLQEIGVDIVTLANNHILDYGADALLDSCAVLDEAGINYVGAGENLERAQQLVTMEAGGRTIGFLGVSRVYMDGSWAASDSRPGVFSTYDSTLPRQEIEKASALCDYLVVYVHWGVERETEPKEYQRTMGREYIDAGADLVVGSHPHVLQEIEYYQGKPIVYSLGNFVFGSSIPRTQLLKVEIREEGPVVSVIPCTSTAGYTRAEGDETIVQP